MRNKAITAALVIAVAYLAWRNRRRLLPAPQDETARLLSRQYAEGWGYGD